VPTFRNTLSHLHTSCEQEYSSMKKEQAECSETSAYKIQTPWNHPKERIHHSQHGDNFKSRIFIMIIIIIILIANKSQYGHGLLQFCFGFALKYDLRKVQENQEKRIVWGDSFCPGTSNTPSSQPSCIRSSSCWYSSYTM
jgi:hypothetical protein